MKRGWERREGGGRSTHLGASVFAGRQVRVVRCVEREGFVDAEVGIVQSDEHLWCMSVVYGCSV
jgi:hypothetical protein